MPEIRLALATEITPLWHATELFLEREGVAPPYWAFAWPGAQALARHLLDTPAAVAARRVLDFAAGGGLAAIAAARAGAARVEASEIDPLAIAAIGHNAALNSVTVHAEAADLVGTPNRWDVVLCGDICYEAPMTGHVLPWLRTLARDGATVLLADPGRAYRPADATLDDTGLVFDVPVSRELEDRDIRRTVLYRLRP